MHQLEPHFRWRLEYKAEEDKRSPFYGREYSEFEFSQKVYNYFIHPMYFYNLVVFFQKRQTYPQLRLNAEIYYFD